LPINSTRSGATSGSSLMAMVQMQESSKPPRKVNIQDFVRFHDRMAEGLVPP